MTSPVTTNTAPPKSYVALDLSGILKHSIQLIVNRWESKRPLHWVSKNGDEVIAEGRFLEAPGLPILTLEEDDGRKFSDTIPASVLAISKLMPSMDFALTQACSASRFAVQMAERSPLFFILLVSFADEQQLTIDDFKQLLTCKRTTLLEMIGLPPSQSIARLIDRIELTQLLPADIRRIVNLLSNADTLSLLRHHPNLHLNHFKLLEREALIHWPNMLYLVDRNSSRADIKELSQTIEDTLNMTGGNTQALVHVNSIQALHDLHDRTVIRFNEKNPESKLALRAEALAQQHGDYPTPPISTISGIEPLTSWYELLAEGVAMHHCVGGYGASVAGGSVFIYRMTSPKRLTISLTLRSNRWRVEQIRGKYNATPTPEVKRKILQWVEEEQASR